jgi:hypothetical protein
VPPAITRQRGEPSRPTWPTADARRALRGLCCARPRHPHRSSAWPVIDGNPPPPWGACACAIRVRQPIAPGPRTTLAVLALGLELRRVEHLRRRSAERARRDASSRFDHPERQPRRQGTSKPATFRFLQVAGERAQTVHPRQHRRQRGTKDQPLPPGAPAVAKTGYRPPPTATNANLKAALSGGAERRRRQGWQVVTRQSARPPRACVTRAPARWEASKPLRIGKRATGQLDRPHGSLTKRLPGRAARHSVDKQPARRSASPAQGAEAAMWCPREGEMTKGPTNEIRTVPTRPDATTPALHHDRAQGTLSHSQPFAVSGQLWTGQANSRLLLRNAEASQRQSLLRHRGQRHDPARARIRGNQRTCSDARDLAERCFVAAAGPLPTPESAVRVGPPTHSRWANDTSDGGSDTPAVHVARSRSRGVAVAPRRRRHRRAQEAAPRRPADVVRVDLTGRPRGSLTLRPSVTAAPRIARDDAPPSERQHDQAGGARLRRLATVAAAR